MEYQNADIARVATELKSALANNDDKKAILNDPALRALFDQLKTLPPELKPDFGRQLNQLKNELLDLINSSPTRLIAKKPIDVTAPYDVNTPENEKQLLLPTIGGTAHPLMTELDTVLGIFYGMGFTAIESRQLDDDYHMFSSLNFPADHPARDDYDSFMTEDGLFAPAHTSTMQNRVLKRFKANLENGQPIAVVIPGRVFRNEDVDARHEHTFYQLEGVYVDKDVNAGNLIATLKTFLETYYNQDLEVKTQPFYFPFTEPSFEFALSCPFCHKKGCHVCSFSGWIELLGCGMIHPNVLKMAGIDPEVFSGFAWGSGIERLVMMKYDINDIRYFEAGRLEFLRQFK